MLTMFIISSQCVCSAVAGVILHRAIGSSTFSNTGCAEHAQSPHESFDVARVTAAPFTIPTVPLVRPSCGAALRRCGMNA